MFDDIARTMKAEAPNLFQDFERDAAQFGRAGFDLSDRGVDDEHAPIPSLLACAAETEPAELTSRRINWTSPRKNSSVIAQKEMIAAMIWFFVSTDARQPIER